jgi:hypothetical protein
MAAEIADPGYRAALLETAQRWRDLADQVERAEIRTQEENSK